MTGFSLPRTTSPSLTVSVSSSPCFHPCPWTISMGIVSRYDPPILTRVRVNFTGMAGYSDTATFKYNIAENIARLEE